MASSSSSDGAASENDSANSVGSSSDNNNNNNNSLDNLSSSSLLLDGSGSSNGYAANEQKRTNVIEQQQPEVGSAAAAAAPLEANQSLLANVKLQLPECCTYKQVYWRLINLLEQIGKRDPVLMSAYLDELQVCYLISISSLLVFSPPSSERKKQDPARAASR